MPKHIIDIGDQTISGSLSATGSIIGTNLVYNTNTNQSIDGQKTFLQNIVCNGTANRLPNQLAGSSDAIMTRGINDADLQDVNVLRLWDDFFNVTDGLGLQGYYAWLPQSIIGTGSIRPNNYTGFGVMGIHTAAVLRGSTTLQWDTSNIIGGGGFIFGDNGLENPTTVYKTRFKLLSLDGGMGAGFAGYSASVYKYNRFFGVVYTKPPAVWSSSTIINLNEYRKPVVSNGRRYYASVGGTTGTVEPTWPTTAGGSVVDGSVTWVEFGSEGHVNLRLNDTPNTADEAIGTFVDTGIPAVANTWYNVVMTYVSVGVWNFNINGVNVGNLIMSATNKSSSFLGTYRVETHTLTAQQLSVDYFLLFSRGITRPTY